MMQYNLELHYFTPHKCVIIQIMPNYDIQKANNISHTIDLNGNDISRKLALHTIQTTSIMRQNHDQYSHK